MPIVFESGDLFENRHGAAAFAHGCNCQGSMGAGIAKAFREKYPSMFEAYRARCKASPREFNLGDCWLWKADDRPWVFNLGTQEGYWRSRATYEAVEASLRALRSQADAEGVGRIAMPRIGAGLGGLSWKKVRAIIEAVFEGWPGTLVVYETFVPTENPDEPARTEEAPKPSRRSRSKTKGADAMPANDSDPIKFYSVSEPFGGFSNFSPHPVTLDGKVWPTSEHYFQAKKFEGHPDEEEIRKTASPMVAARMGRSRKRPLRKDWESVKDQVMYKAVHAKFTQHADLNRVLLDTGDRKLIEHTENDSYWGDGGDGSGKNRLGQILMRVRQELREAGRVP